MADEKTTANDLEIIQNPVDLNGQRLTNGAKTQRDTDIITKGEVKTMMSVGTPQFVIRDGFLIMQVSEEGDES